MNRVIFAPDYFPDPAIGRPIANGNIYVGIVDLDPTIEANRKGVSIQEEDGTIVPISVASQPIRTSSGGEPIYNGSIVTILTDGNYSLAITDKNDVQKYYMASEPGFKDKFTSVDNMLDLIGLTGQEDGNTANVGGYFTSSPQSSFSGGGVFVWQENLNKSDANGGTIIDPDNVGGFDGTVSTRDAFINAQGGGVGLGCWVRQSTDSINITWFGTIGDGIEDDYAAVQAAFDSGTSIYVPEGKFKLVTGLKINKSEFSLFGDGQYVSLFEVQTDGITAITIEDDDPFNNQLEFINIASIGIRPTTVGGVNYTSGGGMLFRNVSKVTLTGIYVRNLYGGIIFYGGGNVFASNWRIQSDQRFAALAGGSYLLKFASYTSVSGVKYPASFALDGFNLRGSSNNGFLDDGIVVEASDGVWLSNGHIGGMSGSCLEVVGVAANSDFIGGINCSNVHFDGMGVSKYGIKYTIDPTYTGTCEGHSYDGCLYSLMQNDGVFVNGGDSVDNLSFTGGRMNSWGAAGGNNAGFRIQDTKSINIQSINIYAGGSEEEVGIVIQDSDFCNIDTIIDGKSRVGFVGINFTGESTRNNINLTALNCAKDIDISGLTNDDNTIAGTTNQSFTIASAADISIPFLHEVASITGTTTIDTINADSALLWRKIIMRFASTCIVTDGTIKLAGAYTSTPGSTLSLMYDGTDWSEIARAIV